MYIRRKVFSIAQDIQTGEERLFSVNEIQREEKEKRSEARKIGKGVALTGGAIGLSTVPGFYKTIGDRQKAIKKIAKKTGTVNIGGDGLSRPARYYGNDSKNLEKAAALDRKHGKLVEKKSKETRSCRYGWYRSCSCWNGSLWIWSL